MPIQDSKESFKNVVHQAFRNSPDLGEPVRTLARLRAGTRLTEREGVGAMANIDFEFNRNSRFQVKALLDQSSNDVLSEFLTHNFGRGKIVSLQPGSGFFENMLLEKQFLERHDENRSGSIVLAAEQRVGSWEFEESIGYSFAASDSSGAQNATFQTARIYDGGYDTAGSPETPPVPLFLNGDPQSPGKLMDPEMYPFLRYKLIDNSADDNEVALRFNAGRRWESSAAGWIFKAGLKSRMREADQGQDKRRTLPGESDFTLSAVAAAGPETVFRGLYAIGPSWDPHAMEAFFLGNPDAFALDEANSLIDSLASDFTVEEDIHSAYAMVQRESDRWVFIMGMRFERTDLEATGYETILARNESGGRDVDVRPVTISDSYNKRILSPLPPCLRHPHAGERGRYPLYPGHARPCQTGDHRDLHPCLHPSAQSDPRIHPPARMHSEAAAEIRAELADMRDEEGAGCGD